MKILVTGGAGFIGSAVCRHLVGVLGHSVVAIDKLTYAGHLSSLASVAGHPNFTFVHADVCDRGAMDAAFVTHQPDAVMHLAAESHVDRSIGAPLEFIQTNIVGTSVMLEAARGHWVRLGAAARARFRFHHVSTDEVFGPQSSGDFAGETVRMSPRSPYAASKAAADHLASAWWHTYGLPVVISNSSNNYGPYQLCEKLIPVAILNAAEGLPISVYGDGQNVRDWIYVEDHVQALVLILTQGTPGETYNVGARTERTNISVVEQICDLVERHTGLHQRRELITFVTDRPGHDRRYGVDPSKLEAQLGWRATEKFDTGLESTVRWYLENKAWWLPLRAAGHGKIRIGTLAESSTP